jgi:cell envelope opacity-associated protein A
MAKIEKPAATQIAPPKRKTAIQKKEKATPATTSKPSPVDVKPIQFKVPASMHQELKLYAVEQGMSMTDLFLEMYKEYRSKHG